MHVYLWVIRVVFVLVSPVLDFVYVSEDEDSLTLRLGDLIHFYKKLK